MMEIEITKTENGFHCEDSDNGENCFETPHSLLEYLKQFLPTGIGVKIKMESVE